MIVATAHIEGIAPLQFSRQVFEPKKEREKADDYEARTWWMRAHRGEGNGLFIPPMAFYHATCTAAKKYLGQIPGEGKKTWTSVFISGIMVMEPSWLDARIVPSKNGEPELDGVVKLTLSVPSDGTPGGGKRVVKHFPSVNPPWSTSVVYNVIDPKITEGLLRQAIEAAGKYIGVLSFRPENRGYFGRFTLLDLEWDEGE